MADVRSLKSEASATALGRTQMANLTRIIRLTSLYTDPKAANMPNDPPASVYLTAAGDSPWVRLYDQTNVTFQVNFIGGSFTASFQQSLDGGGNFYPVTPEAGSTSTTATFSAAGLYRFTGPLGIMKVNVSAISGLATPTNAAFSTATTGGSLVAGTYYYRVSATNALGETLASPETSQVVPAGTATNTVTVNWGAITGATGYRVYGRTTGAEQFIAAVGAVTTYTDTGAITPAGALPASNTTGGADVWVAANKT